MTTTNGWKTCAYCSRTYCCEIERRVGGERRRDVRSDDHRKTPRRARRNRPRGLIDHPHEQRALRRQHQREKRHQTERHAPVQAAMPDGLVRLDSSAAFAQTSAAL